MKKLFLLFSLILIFDFSVEANVFASQVKYLNPDGTPFDGKFSDGTGLKISYILNDTATQVLVKVFDGANIVATLTANNQSLGENFINWNGQGTVTGKSYTLEFSTMQSRYSDTKYTITQMIKTYESKALYSRGCDAQRNPNHPNFGFIYSANSDGSEERLRTGITRWNASGAYAGTVDGHPMLMASLGILHAGGTIDWGTNAPWYSSLDADGRIYASSNGGNKIFRMLNDTTLPKIICSGRLNQPRGLCIVGTGINTTVYIGADTNVYRAKFVTGDTLGNLELVATLGNYVRDIIIDDDGFLIVGLRNGTTGAAGGAIERFDLNGTLPKKRVDAMWSISLSTHSVVGLALKRGANLTSANDDTLYSSIRDAAEPGIHEITLINEFFPTKNYIAQPTLHPGSQGGNISANADLTLDYANNIILFENGNEEIFMISPPSASPQTTIIVKANLKLNVGTSVDDEKKSLLPHKYFLGQNYPNPFNPKTTISYTMPHSGKVELVVYNSLGQMKSVLFSGMQSEGFHTVEFNAKGLSSGIYFYQIKINPSTKSGHAFGETKKMILTK